jgi:hypothetical protein
MAEAATTFELEPGSAIHLASGGWETLTGTFTWSDGFLVPDPRDPEGPPLTVYDVTTFQLQSDSVTLRLGLMPLQVFQSPAGLSASEFAWSGYATSAGWPTPTVMLNSRVGGFWDGGSPVPRLVFPEVELLDPAGGGPPLGSLSFSAVVVPEPSPWMLLAVALLAGCARRWWPCAS